MQHQIFQLTKELISIQSDPGNTLALNEILEFCITHLDGFTVQRFERNGVKSALIHNQKPGHKHFEVILNGHLDVIPGKPDQYVPRVEGDKLFGVGAMDTKASVAAFILIFRELAHSLNYPIALQLTTDEEVGGLDSTKYQVEQGIRADFVLAGEPTNFEIVNQAKGIFQAKITSYGEAVHSAYPWRGANAILRMNQFLNDLTRRFPIPSAEVWATTVSVSRIETTNASFNKTPDNCTVWLDVRFVPEDMDSIKRDIASMMPKDFKLDINFHEPALQTEATDPHLLVLAAATEQVRGVRTPIRSANGSSDARHFTVIGCPGIEFGPIGGGIGSDAEWVSITSLGDHYEILKSFLKSLH